MNRSVSSNAASVMIMNALLDTVKTQKKQQNCDKKEQTSPAVKVTIPQKKIQNETKNGQNAKKKP